MRPSASANIWQPFSLRPRLQKIRAAKRSYSRPMRGIRFWRATLPLGCAHRRGPLSHETSHPRGWGSAARILGHYVRDEKLLRLEEAVRKMTSFAAEAAGLNDRGLVKPGFAADLVVFDPVTVRDRATFEQPNQYSEGFHYVAVNGVLVVDGGRLTGKTPGQPLRGPGYRKEF
jgi:hypothetical protein